jgi:hypothetical protein
MARKEKGRPAGGDPIPNSSVRQDNPEFKAQPLNLQVQLLTQRYAISAALASGVSL